jgi:hypothetical protein
MIVEVFVMPNPFPGMNPYLEGRRWRGVHHDLITAIEYALAPQVAPRYYVAIEERAYIREVDSGEFTRYPDAAVITAVPDAEPSPRGGTATLVRAEVERVALPGYENRREAYLEIRDVETHEVITAIEVLSPTNKEPGPGRREYAAKRRQVLSTWTSLVEIDLLRGGKPMEFAPPTPRDYRILVVAGWEYPQGRLSAFSLRQAIPVVEVPLREGEQEPALALGPLLNEIYDRARYDLRIDYRHDPLDPALSAEDTAWLDALLREKGLRG